MCDYCLQVKCQPEIQIPDRFLTEHDIKGGDTVVFVPIQQENGGIYAERHTKSPIYDRDTFILPKRLYDQFDWQYGEKMWCAIVPVSEYNEEDFEHVREN